MGMNHNFKKKFGQNFLNNDGIINKIVDSINPGVDDLIIEIGPGAGALTKKLKKYNSQLICFEIDTDLKSKLSSLEDEKTKIIFEDFMVTDVKKIISDYKYNKLYIIGNLPYYITTPIVEKIIELNIDPESVVIMIQNEVANRFAAKPGSKEYGSISVYLNYYFIVEKLFVVNRNNFYPIPNVDSAILRLTNNNNDYNIDFEKFNKLVKDAFNMKRKNLRNNLKSYNLELIESILNEFNKSLNDRAENLTLEEFIELSKRI